MSLDVFLGHCITVNSCHLVTFLLDDLDDLEKTAEPQTGVHDTCSASVQVLISTIDISTKNKIVVAFVNIIYTSSNRSDQHVHVHCVRLKLYVTTNF